MGSERAPDFSKSLGRILISSLGFTPGQTSTETRHEAWPDNAAQIETGMNDKCPAR